MGQDENTGTHLAEGAFPEMPPIVNPTAVPPVTTWTAAELVAYVTGRRRPFLLPSWEQDFLGMASCSEAMLAEMLDLGPVQARRLAAALEIARRLTSSRDAVHIPCRAPADVAAIMRPLVLIDHERLWCLPLDSHIRLMGSPIEVARGDVDGTDASPRAVCRAALRARASTMIVVHNHPSGDPTPSPADIAVTRRLVAAGRTVDIPLADHVVITADGRFSSLRRDHAEAWM